MLFLLGAVHKPTGDALPCQEDKKETKHHQG
jgi:hypothetical protein